MTLENPLRNYFRRPALYLTLPSKGQGYPAGSIEMPDNGELPVYPMTAIDEITTRTPDALYNGQAVVELIRSCVPSIKDPWKLPQVDLDPVLLAIKIATNGNQMEIETTCPECKEPSRYDINLTGMLSNFKPGNYNELLKVDDVVQVKFKPLDYARINSASQQQFDVQRALVIIDNIEDNKDKEEKTNGLIKEMTEMAMQLVIDTIEFVKTPEATVFDKEHVKEFLSNVPIKTYEKIRDHTITLKQSTETKPLEFTCPSCTNAYKQPFNINVSDFFV